MAESLTLQELDGEPSKSLCIDIYLTFSHLNLSEENGPGHEILFVRL